MAVKVQKEDFDAPAEVGAMYDNCANPGAVGTFTGLVRSRDNDKELIALELEHYPGMGEKQLEKIVADILMDMARRDRLKSGHGWCAPTERLGVYGPDHDMPQIKRRLDQRNG
ncbi:MAG: molybdenum cofactor biosynthesis protein MoaE [Proteobacteria bacterium]|nr:molybdenum cofactor biosynthesis protein MoaE [Pseudomonadota bacterium]